MFDCYTSSFVFLCFISSVDTTGVLRALQCSSDGIGSGLDNAVVQKTTNSSVVVEAGDSNGWLAARFVYLLAFAHVN